MALKWNAIGDGLKPARKPPSQRMRMITTQWQYTAKLYHEMGLPCPIVPPVYAGREKLYWSIVWAQIHELLLLHKQLDEALDAWEAANPIEARLTPWWEGRQRVKREGYDQDELILLLAISVQRQFHLTALGCYKSFNWPKERSEHVKERQSRQRKAATHQKKLQKLAQEIKEFDSSEKI